MSLAPILATSTRLKSGSTPSASSSSARSSCLGDSNPRYIDAQLKQYRPIGKSWIAPQCEFYIAGTLLQREDYTDIKADVPLSEALFDPAQWKTAPHWLH